MNKSLRQLFTIVVALFVILGMSTTIIMAIRANQLTNDARNVRALYHEYGAPRGSILAADGSVIAKSDPSNDSFSYQRSYSAGELYAPVVNGYPDQYQGGKITNKYASWTDDNFFVTVGDFYDQYGSGLIFRAYEDRALGVNTSVEGVRAGMNIGDAFAIRAMLGRPRLYMEYAPSWLRGSGSSRSIWRSKAATCRSTTRRV